LEFIKKELVEGQDIRGVIESVKNEYLAKFGDEPTQLIVDNLTIWDLLPADVKPADACGMTIRIFVTSPPMILVTNNADVKTLVELQIEGAEPGND
jgi:hypothetical protein